MSEPSSPRRVVVVTGANGLVGSRTCAALVDRGVAVRAVVRRPGTAPELEGVEEWVGDFYDPDLAAAVVKGATPSSRPSTRWGPTARPSTGSR